MTASPSPSEARDAIERVKALESAFMYAGDGRRIHSTLIPVADLSVLLAVVEAQGKALKPFSKKWVDLKDPLPQGPFTIAVDAMACCEAFRAYSLTAETEGEDHADRN